MLDETAQTSTIAVTITDYVAGNWSIRTGQPANIVLYNVAPLPEITSLSASHTSAGQLQLTWSGQKLDETEISVYVTPDIGVEGTSDAGELGVLIGRLSDLEATGQTMTLDLPADLQTGDYYVRLIASKQDSVNQTIVATRPNGEACTFRHTNRDQPAPPGAVSLENSGDERFRVQVVPGSDASTYDGYCVSIFESTAGGLVPTDFTGLFFQKDAHGNMPEMIVGGTYFTTDGHAYGLTAGKSYVAQVAAYKLKAPGIPGEDDLVILSTDAISAAGQLLPATPPTATFRPQSSHKVLPRMVQTGLGTQEKVQVPTFTSGEVAFSLQTDVPVSGYWTIDGLLAQDLTDSTGSALNMVDDVSLVNVTQQLCDGDHVVSFVGTDQQGDNLCFSKLFAVDTTPPRLMLTSPNNGSFFEEDGTLWIEGLGDKDALYTVVVDGVTLIKRHTLASLGVTLDPKNGVLRLRVDVEPGVSSHRVLVIAEDAVGNSAVHQATVQNQGLGKIASVNVLADGALLPGKNIPLAGPGNTGALLQLAGITETGSQLLINDSNLVQWTAVAKRGNAEVEADGQLTIAPSSIGFVEGALRISDTFSLTDALAFGAEVNLVGLRHLVVASTIGGTATGEGAYLPGAEVKLTATPAPGYRFVKWVTSGGGSFTSASAATTGFTMPDQNVVVTAQFKYINSGTIDPPEQPDPDTSEEPEPEPEPEPEILDPEQPVPPDPETEQPEEPEENLFNAGTFASIALPEQMAKNPQGVVACYMVGQREVIVPLCAILGGKMVFRAPATASYYLKRAQPKLRDIDQHWARGVIHFVASRGLLRETGNQLFSPQTPMT
ncbi:MAG TPA: hypothetical protein DDZ53_12340, partial [Firmicutes bacterium]|nr:hypothetical protein [Bacillota bacterium]